MIRGRLILEAPAGELEATLARFAEGPVDLMLEAVELEASDELLRHDLRPQSIVAVSVLTVDADDLPEERAGPLCRLYATQLPAGGLHG